MFNHVLLSTEKINCDAYQLNVNFFKQNGLHSSKRFIFIKQDGGMGREIVDIYSLNCGLSTNLSGVFSKRDIKHLKPSVAKIDSAYPTIFTLDMKDAQNGYIPKEIVLGEKTVCASLSSREITTSKSFCQAQKLLQNRLDFVYCEGSLKGKLLYQFEEREVQYLNSSEGAQVFCKLAEVFMNAAKFGHVQQEIEPEQYIYSLHKSIAFQTYQKSTIWYPELYKDSVASVATIFQPVFTTASSYDSSTGITTLTMEAKV